MVSDFHFVNIINIINIKRAPVNIQTLYLRMVSGTGKSVHVSLDRVVALSVFINERWRGF